MQGLNKLTPSEREKKLRSAVRRRFADIPSDRLDYICERLNTARPYCIKHTTDKQRFLNLITREWIVQEDLCVITEVLPLYGDFHAPSFEKIGLSRQATPGRLNDTQPAAAVTIRVGREGGRCSSTHALILYN